MFQRIPLSSLLILCNELDVKKDQIVRLFTILWPCEIFQKCNPCLISLQNGRPQFPFTTSDLEGFETRSCRRNRNSKFEMKTIDSVFIAISYLSLYNIFLSTKKKSVSIFETVDLIQMNFFGFCFRSLSMSSVTI